MTRRIGRAYEVSDEGYRIRWRQVSYLLPELKRVARAFFVNYWKKQNGMVVNEDLMDRLYGRMEYIKEFIRQRLGPEHANEVMGRILISAGVWGMQQADRLVTFQNRDPPCSLDDEY